MLEGSGFPVGAFVTGEPGAWVTSGVAAGLAATSPAAEDAGATRVEWSSSEVPEVIPADWGGDCGMAPDAELPPEPPGCTSTRGET